MIQIQGQKRGGEVFDIEADYVTFTFPDGRDIELRAVTDYGGGNLRLQAMASPGADFTVKPVAGNVVDLSA